MSLPPLTYLGARSWVRSGPPESGRSRLLACLDFSQSLEVRQDWRQVVRIQPEPREWRVRVDGSALHLSFRARQGTFRIHVDGSLQATMGQVLGAPVEVPVSPTSCAGGVGPPSPRLTCRVLSPRFLRPQDTPVFEVLVRNRSRRAVPVTVGMGAPYAWSSSSGEVPARGTLRAGFPNEVWGNRAYRFELALSCGGEHLETILMRLPLVVDPSHNIEIRGGILQGTQRIPLPQRGGTRYSSSLLVRLSTNPGPPLISLVRSLARCGFPGPETSAWRLLAFSSILGSAAADWVPRPALARIREIAQRDHAELVRALLPGVGFPRWPGDPCDAFLTLFAGLSLLQAGLVGLEIPLDLARTLSAMAENLPASWPTRTRRAWRAGAAWALGRLGAPAGPPLEGPAESLEEAAFRLSSVASEGREVLEQEALARSQQSDQALRGWPPSASRSLALFLAAFTSPDSAVVFGLARRLLDSGLFRSVQDQAWAVLGLSALGPALESAGKPARVRVCLAGEAILRRRLGQRRRFASVLVREVSQQVADVRLQHNGGGPLFYETYHWELVYLRPWEDTVESLREGLQVERRYEDLDGMPLGPRTWPPVGAGIQVRITVTSSEAGSDVQIVDFLPGNLCVQAEEGAIRCEPPQAAQVVHFVRCDRVELLVRALPAGTCSFIFQAVVCADGSFAAPPTRAWLRERPEVRGSANWNRLESHRDRSDPPAGEVQSLPDGMVTCDSRRDVLQCDWMAGFERPFIKRDGSVWDYSSMPPLREIIRKALLGILLLPLFVLAWLSDRLEALVYGPAAKRGGTIHVEDCHFHDYGPTRLPERKARQVRGRLRAMGCREPHVQKR